MRILYEQDQLLKRIGETLQGRLAARTFEQTEVEVSGI
jgi:hypothetical protein